MNQFEEIGKIVVKNLQIRELITQYCKGIYTIDSLETIQDKRKMLEILGDMPYIFSDKESFTDKVTDFTDIDKR